ncbi:PP2C family protein-serine/threonine phosphatase [Bailinhaonella thermotolerans]|uniref:PP2C family protein-serine/threonine phosphatase n=1 Tax=Bailinhaonella thermotolerans TaxID=1070861 RepID=UPI001F5B475B|nr:SpoIIE family protein phosphatase [Bailinhaonella thermotolerans]
MRVLLVEDDAGDALLVEELLADSGLVTELRWVTTLGEATKAVGDFPAQCVLLDLHLPDAQGLPALDQVLSSAPEAAVVVLTGWAEQEAGLAAVAAGAQDYLIKGQVEPDLFGRAIRYAVHRKQAERTAAALQAERIRSQENARLERGLLPVPLLSKAPMAVASRARPGRASSLLGGDFFDVVEADDGTVHAVIGDVCGHGPNEAALGVCLRIAWRTLVLSGLSRQRLMEQLDRILRAERSSPEIFATVCTIELPPDRHTVRVLRAGHPGVLVHTPATVELYEPDPGLALGLPFEDERWPQSELALPQDAALVLFTDGLFEGRLSAGGRQRLGERGLVALARECAHLSGERFVDALLAKVDAATAEGGGLTDDVAVMHLKWSEE